MTLELKQSSLSDPRLPAFPLPGAAPFNGATAPLPEYLLDAIQRSVLLLDLLRQRGNEEIEITSRPTATVLRFEHEEVMSGRTLPRPINYSLLRIRPLAWRSH